MISKLLVSAMLLLAPLQPIGDGRALVRAMHDQYAGKWYSTLTFTQKTTNVEADGTEKVETWQERIACPGKLRIDIEPVAEGGRILFADDMLYRYEKGKQVESRPLVHPLLVLGFDVYCQSPETIADKLSKLGIDLSVVRETTYDGKAVYVVGAKEGDERSPQFWIEKDRLLFVRLIRPAGKDGAKVSDVVFDKYEKAGGGWVAAEVRFSVDGKLATTEEYTDIKADVPLDPAIFDPAGK